MFLDAKFIFVWNTELPFSQKTLLTVLRSDISGVDADIGE